MPEKETRTALEMAASIGSSSVQLDQNWQSVGGINLGLLIENLGEEIGLSRFEWQKIFVQAGSWLIDNLDQRIISVQEKAVEQNTAIELRKMFGVPLSLLAMPVFVELEKMELLARIDLKTEALTISRIWEQINSRVLYLIQLFLAEQINRAEEESVTHQKALEESRAEAKLANGALGETIQIVERKFMVKMAELEKKKQLLLKIFTGIKTQITDSVEKSFETTIFQSANQQLATTVIR